MKILAALLLSLSLAGFAYSDQIAKDLKLEVLDNFDLGLVSNLSSNKQSKNSATKVRNFYGDKKIGCLVKGGGTEVAGSTPTLMDIRAGITFYHTDGSKEFLVADSSQVFVTTDYRSYRAIVTALNTNYGVQMEQIEGDIWITNGFNTVAVYTSTGGVYRHTNIPKGRYIEYNPDGRVWMYGTPEDASELRFSAIRSTDGLAIQPTDRRAWPASHSIYVNRGDGEQGTFVKNLAGTLICGKESSIHRIEGKDPSSYKPVLVSKNGGVISAESVTEDGAYLYGQGRDGFYEINATTVRRITDHISPDVELIRTDALKTGVLTWDTANEFSRGSTLSGTTVTGNGFVTIMSTNYLNALNTGGAFPSGMDIYLNSASSSTHFMTLSSHAVNGSNVYAGAVSQIGIFVDDYAFPDSAPTDAMVTLRKKSTNTFINVKRNLSIGGPDLLNVAMPTTFYFSIQDVINQDIQLKIELDLVNTPGQGMFLSTPTNPGFGNIVFLTTTSSYLSEISTAGTVAAWNNFEAITNTNGGSISFFYKAASSAVNIATYPWISISPGSVIGSTPTNTYIQWTATITSVSSMTSIDSVEINYLQGIAANTRSFGTKWDGRWWIGVSTEGTGNFPLIYKKYKNTNSFKDAFTQFDGIPIRCFWKDGDSVLYGGGSTWAAVMRLDYGTSYNGSPITAYWETPESVDFEFTNIYDNAQDEQFDIVRSTPVVDDLKEGQIFIYLSTNSQHPILFLRAGTSNYIIRTEPYR